MKRPHIALSPGVPALQYAGDFLLDRGWHLVPTPDVPDCCFLLPVPTPPGILSQCTPDRLPPGVTLIGGGLPDLTDTPYRAVDLLKYAPYVAQNAALTAKCALRLAEASLPRLWQDCPVLVLGFGRIGKFLTRELLAQGARVLVAARKEADRALVSALGAASQEPEKITGYLPHMRVIFNTIPAPVLSAAQTALCRPDCIALDLASVPGMEGASVRSARGLPGKMMPESAGALIGRAIIAHPALREAMS